MTKNQSVCSLYTGMSRITAGQILVHTCMFPVHGDEPD